MSVATGALQLTEPGDAYVDYCLWPYEPLAPVVGKLRSVNLLERSFLASGVDSRIVAICDAIQSGMGGFNTVYGVKRTPAGYSWELYFYDYRRLERVRSISRLLRVLEPWVRCALCYDERRAYFMFSIDLDDELVTGRRDLDEINVYVGNPGSAVSSGICYSLTGRGLRLDNLYCFFNRATEYEDVVAKVLCSAHLDLPGLDVDRILWPELVDCETIVVSNKRLNEGVYFSRIRAPQLLRFLERMEYPETITGFVRENLPRLDHLLFDVGIDYVMRDGRVEILKSAYYGVF